MKNTIIRCSHLDEPLVLGEGEIEVSFRVAGERLEIGIIRFGKDKTQALCRHIANTRDGEKYKITIKQVDE